MPKKKKDSTVVTLTLPPSESTSTSPVATAPTTTPATSTTTSTTATPTTATSTTATSTTATSTTATSTTATSTTATSTTATSTTAKSKKSKSKSKAQEANTSSQSSALSSQSSPSTPQSPSDSVVSPERVALLTRLLDGAIPGDEQAQLLALRGFWPGFIGQVDVGSKKRAKAPAAVCTVTQGLTVSALPNTRSIAKETINNRNERVIFVEDKDPKKVVVPPKGSAGYGLEFAMWTPTRDREVFDIFNHVVTELLLHDVDYLSLVTDNPFVLIDKVVYGQEGPPWALMLSLAPPSSPLHGVHSLKNGTFRFIQMAIVTSQEHFAMCCLPHAGGVLPKLTGVTDRARPSVVEFNPEVSPASTDHLRQAIVENDVKKVDRWVSATLELCSAELKHPTLIEGVCYRDHPLVLACKKERNPAIFMSLIKAVPKLPILQSRFRSSKAPSRLAHVFFEAITQDQPLIVKELLRPDAELKVDVDVRCLSQQETGLHLASLNQSSVETVSVLLEHKADVLAKMDGEVTCLISAAQAGAVDIVRLLLQHAKRTLPEQAFVDWVNAREVKGATALMLAALCDQPACVELLLANGADKSLTLQGPAEIMSAKEFAKMGRSKACFALLGGEEDDLEEPMPALV